MARRARLCSWNGNSSTLPRGKNTAISNKPQETSWCNTEMNTQPDQDKADKKKRTEASDGRLLKWGHRTPKLPNRNQWHTRARSFSKVNENAIATAICECAICLLPLGSSHETPTNTTVASLPNNKRCKPAQERKEAIKLKQTEENGHIQQQSISKRMQKPPH